MMRNLCLLALALVFLTQQAAPALSTKDNTPPLLQGEHWPHPFALQTKPEQPKKVETLRRNSPEEAFMDRVQVCEIHADEIATEMIMAFNRQVEASSDITTEGDDAAYKLDQLATQLERSQPPAACQAVADAALRMLRGMETFYRAVGTGSNRKSLKALIAAQEAYGRYVTACRSIRFEPAVDRALIERIMTNDCVEVSATAAGPKKPFEARAATIREDMESYCGPPEEMFRYPHSTHYYLHGLWRILCSGTYSPDLASAYLCWRSEMQSGYFGSSNWSEIPNEQYNQVRFRTLAIVQAHLRTHPNDPVALAQKGVLLHLPSIHRGGLLGNDSLMPVIDAGRTQ